MGKQGENGGVKVEFQDKCCMVIGTGISGIGAAILLYEKGAKITIYDANKKVDINKVQEKLGEIKADIIIGEFDYDTIPSYDLLVISPGVPIDNPIVMSFKEQNIPVWGEIELAYHFEKGTIVAITGTNGKTTTTALTGQIIGAWTKSAYVVGNIGNPYTTQVDKTDKDSYTIAEISSFQLETIHEFHPKVSAILNITPDHLDRHHTMECYVETKKRISVNQNKSDVCVLNYEDSYLVDFGNICNADVIWFSSKRKPLKSAKTQKSVYVEGDLIKYTDGKTDFDIIHVQDMNLIGVHNYENVCAAIAMCVAVGVPLDIIINEVKHFKAVEHRIEYVATKNDVVYYNDSKGTNPDASIKAIKAMSRPTILIGGGFDKGADFDMYVAAFNPMIKLLVLMGQTSEKIAEAAKKQGFENIIYAKDLEEVVHICAAHAKPGDAVLLSPACASWDMFDNYEQRGRMFKEYVNLL